MKSNKISVKRSNTFSSSSSNKKSKISKKRVKQNNSNSDSDSSKKHQKKQKKDTEISDLLSSFNKNEIKEKCIIYIRCSSLKQNRIEDNLHGVDTQRQICIDYANENNFEIIKIIEETGSAIDDKIKKLRLWDLPNEYPNTRVIVADPSRLSRNLGTGIQLVQNFINKKCIIYSARDNVSTDSYSGRREIIDSIHRSYDESKVMKKRLRTTIKLKKKNGSTFGSAPYGYKNVRSVNPINNYPIISRQEDLEEQKIIELIKKFYFGSDMESFYQIFRELSHKPDYRMLYGEDEYESICFGYFYYEDIANRLNEKNIFKRNRPWNRKTIGDVISLIKKKTDKHTKLYLSEKYGLLTSIENYSINHQNNYQKKLYYDQDDHNNEEDNNEKDIDITMYILNDKNDCDEVTIMDEDDSDEVTIIDESDQDYQDKYDNQCRYNYDVDKAVNYIMANENID